MNALSPVTLLVSTTLMCCSDRPQRDFSTEEELSNITAEAGAEDSYDCFYIELAATSTPEKTNAPSCWGAGDDVTCEVHSTITKCKSSANFFAVNWFTSPEGRVYGDIFEDGYYYPTVRIHQISPESYHFVDFETQKEIGWCTVDGNQAYVCNILQGY